MSNLARAQAARIAAEQKQAEAERKAREDAFNERRAAEERERERVRREREAAAARASAAALEAKTKRYASGERYIGDFKPGNAARIPHGYGEFVRKDGSTMYDGYWEEGLMHGGGTMTWENDDSWGGTFYRNDLHGRGTYTFSDKSKQPRECIYWHNRRVCWTDELIGRYIEVEHSKNLWRRGIVTAYDAGTGRWRVRLDMEERERALFLDREHFRCVPGDTAMFYI